MALCLKSVLKKYFINNKNNNIYEKTIDFKKKKADDDAFRAPCVVCRDDESGQRTRNADGGQWNKPK